MQSARFAAPDKIKPGIYFIEVEGTITQKVVKIVLLSVPAP